VGNDYYRVLVDDLTVNADGPELTDLFGNPIGYQTVSTTHAKGTVLTEDQVGEATRQSVSDGGMEGYLERVGDSDYEESLELREPFPGYSELSVEEVQAAFKVLPSSAIRAVQEYEGSEYGQGRHGIVDYHIGRGEAFTDRLTGRASSPVQEAGEKPIADIVTREVTDSDFRFGEGPQDDGTPQREIGSLDGDTRTEGEKVAAEGDDKPKVRRGRRSKPADSGSDSKDNDD
jgi:hypothetical protein